MRTRNFDVPGIEALGSVVSFVLRRDCNLKNRGRTIAMPAIRITMSRGCTQGQKSTLVEELHSAFLCAPATVRASGSH